MYDRGVPPQKRGFQTSLCHRPAILTDLNRSEARFPARNSV